MANSLAYKSLKDKLMGALNSSHNNENEEAECYFADGRGEMADYICRTARSSSKPSRVIESLPMTAKTNNN